MIPLNIALSLIFVVLLVVRWQWRCWRFVWQLSGWRGVAAQPILWLSLIRILNPQNVMTYLNWLSQCFLCPIPVVLGNKILLYVENPSSMESIMNAPQCTDKTFLQDGFFANKGMLHKKGQIWKARRKQLNPSFNNSILVGFFETFNTVTNKMLAQLKLEQQSTRVSFQDLANLLSRASLDITCGTILGSESNFTQSDPDGIIPAYHILIENSARKTARPYLQIDFIFRLLQPKNFECNKRTFRFIDDYLSKIVLNKHEAWLRSGTQKPGRESGEPDLDGDWQSTRQKRVFIETLFHLTESGELTLQDIMNETHSMLLVSFETVSTALMCALLSLAAHRDYQQRLRREIVEVLGDDGTADVTAALLQQMPYLDMVVHETLRMFPTVPLVIRNVSDDLRLRLPDGHKAGDSVILPRGSIVSLDLLCMQRGASSWGANSAKFDPEHFAATVDGEPDKTRRHPYSFVPFTKGIRTCIGNRYSIYLMKVVIIKFIAAYDFSSETKIETLEYANTLSLRIKDEHKIFFKISKINKGG